MIFVQPKLYLVIDLRDVVGVGAASFLRGARVDFGAISRVAVGFGEGSRLLLHRQEPGRAQAASRVRSAWLLLRVTGGRRERLAGVGLGILPHVLLGARGCSRGGVGPLWAVRPPAGWWHHRRGLQPAGCLARILERSVIDRICVMPHISRLCEKEG